MNPRLSWFPAEGWLQINANLYIIWFLCCLFIFVLLFDGRFALGEDGGDLPSHEGPRHVGAWEGAALPAWAEYFIVCSLLLDGVSRAGEAKFVMTHSWTLAKTILTHTHPYNISYYLYKMSILKPLSAKVAFQQGIIWKAVRYIWKSRWKFTNISYMETKTWLRTRCS